MTTVEVFAPAKINLTLHVTGRRPDGYHELDSLVAFADVGDTLRLASHTLQLTETGAVPAPAIKGRLSVCGPEGAGVPEDGSNLVMRAISYLDPEAAPFVRLNKSLPSASGIGGGSSDAAAALRGLSVVLGRDALGTQDDAILADLAMGLGADIPMCLTPRPVRASGIGERLSPVDIPVLHAVLVNPRLEVPTGAVFSRLDATDNAPMRWPPEIGSVPGFCGWLRTQRNDLQGPATEICPEIGTVLDRLDRQEGVLLSRMSGSGATCFAIFGSRDAADKAAETIAWFERGWWVRAATLGDMTGRSAPITLPG